MTQPTPKIDAAPLFPPTLISACAGAGKTHRLTNRIIGLLLMGENPSKILALTFSRKAAGEIRARVLDRLTKGASSESEADKLKSELELSSISQQSINTAISALTDGKHQIRFQTFDSFFIEMARCFPAQVGLSRNVAIADSGSLRNIEQQAFERFLDSRTTDQIRAFEAAFNNGPNTGSPEGSSSVTALKPHTKYKSWIAAEFGPLVASPQHEWWIPESQATPAHASTSEILKGLAFWIDGSSLRAIPPKKDGSATPRVRWESNLTKIKLAIEQTNLDELLDSTFLQAISSNKPQYDRADIPEIFFAAWKALNHFIRESIVNSVNQRVSQIKPFLEEFDSFLQTAKRQHQLMSFTDCKRALLSLDISGAAEDVYYRLDGQISHILLDEFQDTSPLEWQILRPLAEEILSKSDGLERTFFCVGDSKQAIYGWRGGQAELLAALARNTTRRCSKNIVSAVNALLDELDTNPAFKEGEKSARLFAKEYQPHLALDSSPDGLFYLEALAPSDDKVNNQQQRIDVYERAAALIHDIHLRCPWARIGVLFTQNQGIAEMRAILSGSKYNLSVSEEGKRPIERFNSVSAILGLLHLLDHPLDSIEAFRLASSPLGLSLGITNHQDRKTIQKKLGALREELYLSGAATFLSKIINQIIDQCSSEEVAQLLKLEELIVSSQIRGVLRAREIIDFINAAMTEDPSDAQIRLLTIHGSKGLEFDVVVLPDLDQDLVARFRRNKLLFWGQPDAPTKVSINPSQKYCQFVPELKEFKDTAFNSFIHEALCCLYVALTRGRYANYLFCSSKEPVGQGISLSSIILSGPYQPTSDFSSFDGQERCGYAVGKLNWWDELAGMRREPITDRASSSPEIDFRGDLCFPALDLKPLKVGKRFIERHSPSDIITRYSSLDSILSISSLPGILTHASEGSLIHEALSKIEWLDSQAHLPKSLLSLIGSDIFQEVFSLVGYERRWANSEINLYLEKSLAAIISDSELSKISGGSVKQSVDISRDNTTLITGSIDRLVIAKDRTTGAISAEVIDFKTDKFHDTKLDQAITRYTPQLKLYGLALSKSHHIPINNISLKLVFLNSNKLVPID